MDLAHDDLHRLSARPIAARFCYQALAAFAKTVSSQFSRLLRHCEERKRRSNPAFALGVIWIASAAALRAMADTSLRSQ
jgi:hypothetical protein